MAEVYHQKFFKEVNYPELHSLATNYSLDFEKYFAYVISSSDITATFTEIEQVNNSVLAVGLDGVVVQVNTNSIEMVDSTEDGKSTQIKENQ